MRLFVYQRLAVVRCAGGLHRCAKTLGKQHLLDDDHGGGVNSAMYMLSMPNGLPSRYLMVVVSAEAIRPATVAWLLLKKGRFVLMVEATHELLRPGQRLINAAERLARVVGPLLAGAEIRLRERVVVTHTRPAK
jgi:hypothetical protein